MSPVAQQRPEMFLRITDSWEESRKQIVGHDDQGKLGHLPLPGGGVWRRVERDDEVRGRVRKHFELLR